MKTTKGGSYFRCFNVRITVTGCALLLLIVGLVSFAYPSTLIKNNGRVQQDTTDWKLVEQALGKSGSMQPGDVYKVSFPRSDLKVTAAGVELKPALALGTWVAFKRMGDMTVVMGDLVLT